MDSTSQPSRPSPVAWRISLLALLILGLDQLTKAAVLRWIPLDHEVVVVDGFFKLVHWGNTGAAWSFFTGNNEALAILGLLALLGLFLGRKHFDTESVIGQISLGLIYGGILGNLYDRLFRQHVIDFIYFHLDRRGAEPIGFPAFNIADSGICVGVGFLFFLALRAQPEPVKATPTVNT